MQYILSKFISLLHQFVVEYLCSYCSLIYEPFNHIPFIHCQTHAYRMIYVVTLALSILKILSKHCDK